MGLLISYKAHVKKIVPRGTFHNDERENIVILSEYVHNDKDSKYMKKKMTKIKWEIDKPTNIVEDFYNPL